MSVTRRLMAVLAHPDDETLGVGGTIAKYAADGVEVSVVSATRGDAGRYRGLRPGEEGHPGQEALGRIREAELRAAATALGVREVSVLGYLDGQLDRAVPREVIGRIVAELRRFRPQVVLTFGPDGAYGHPDHVAISQFTTAAIVAAAGDAHAVSKLYYIAWPESTWKAYQSSVKALSSTVDGVVRVATAWPDWSITTAIDTGDLWTTVWRAVTCHESQLGTYQKLRDLTPEHHRGLWGSQSFYRAFSLVNGGRAVETDLFDGL